MICFPQQDPQGPHSSPVTPILLNFSGQLGKGKDQGSSSHGAQSSVVLGPLNSAHHSSSSCKHGFVSLREGGEYAQHSRNVAAPSCTLPYLEADKINLIDSQLLLLLVLCLCSGWHHSDTNTQQLCSACSPSLQLHKAQESYEIPAVGVFYLNYLTNHARSHPSTC